MTGMLSVPMGIELYQGYGSFIGKHEVQIDEGEVLYGKRIVIATRSSPFVPPIKGLQETGFLTNETTLQLTEQPKSLLVVGGGPIGLEFYCLAKLRTLGYEFEWRLV